MINSRSAIFVRRVLSVPHVSLASSSTSAKQVNAVKRSTVDDVTQSLLSSTSNVPKPLSRIAAALKMKFKKDNIDPSLKILLDGASAKLYFDCANNYNYDKLCQTFGLPDYMSSWFKLTLLHTWMVLMRLHISLDAEAYLRIQRGILSSLWFDVDQRLEIVGKEINQVLSSKSDIQRMHGLHLQTFLEYDEGFLHDDRVLAAAIWRCLYLERECDPIHVLRVVSYIRSSMAWLDSMDLNDILVDGIKEWKQLKPTSTLGTPTNKDD
ncbi:unnamed protein product [Auanema sp. JU1783]|nr:unnamed protein product [Auanema sp. JU1783]